MTLGFENERYSIDEEQSNIEVCVFLHGQIERNVTADIFLGVGGSASLDVDFQFSPTTIHFNETSSPRMCVLIEALQDDIIEDTENFFLDLMLLNMDNETRIILNVSRAEISIGDSTRTTLTFLNSTSEVSEGDIALLCVRNTVILDRAIQVQVIFTEDVGGEIL